MIRAGYRQEHGRRWRREVTRQQLAALRLGELAPAPPTGDISVEAVATQSDTAGDKLPTVHPQLALPPSGADNSGGLLDGEDEIATAGDSSTPAVPAASSDKVDQPSGKRRKRRSMEEWLELATPIYRQEFRKRRKQPTGEEFAAAIELAGYGAVSPSTAKNIRTAIQDEEAKTLSTR
jgi:hypothetical protein